MENSKKSRKLKEDNEMERLRKHLDLWDEIVEESKEQVEVLKRKNPIELLDMLTTSFIGKLMEDDLEDENNEYDDEECYEDYEQFNEELEEEIQEDEEVETEENKENEENEELYLRLVATNTWKCRRTKTEIKLDELTPIHLINIQKTILYELVNKKESSLRRTYYYSILPQLQLTLYKKMKNLALKSLEYDNAKEEFEKCKETYKLNN